MSNAIAYSESPGLFNLPETGSGESSRKLKKYYAKVINEFRKTTTLGRVNEALQSLEEVFFECSEEGWDGYDAHPITEATYFEVEKLIRTLPFLSIPIPEIIPEPGGEIGLEWFKGNRQVFVASLSGKSEIAYAGLFGTNKTHGIEYFSDFLPTVIMVNLKRLYS